MRWILGLFASVFMLLTAGFLATANSRLSNAEAILSSRGERIAILETRSVENRREIEEIKEQLRRIEDKINRILAGVVK